MSSIIINKYHDWNLSWHSWLATRPWSSEKHSRFLFPLMKDPILTFLIQLLSNIGGHRGQIFVKEYIQWRVFSHIKKYFTRWHFEIHCNPCHYKSGAALCFWKTGVFRTSSARYSHLCFTSYYSRKMPENFHYGQKFSVKNSLDSSWYKMKTVKNITKSMPCK